MQENTNNPNPFAGPNSSDQFGSGASGRGDVGRAGAPLGTSAGVGHDPLMAGSSDAPQGTFTPGTRTDDRVSQVKEKAANVKRSLADALESGAEKLRQRSTRVAEPGDMPPSQLTKVGDKVAGGMQRSADWVRNADLESMRSDIETQVRQNPGRSLLIALGIGYVLGKIFRGGRQT